MSTIALMSKRALSLATALALVLSQLPASVAYAAGVMYSPGETLAPACGPTESGCGVRTSVSTADTLTDGALLFASSTAWSLLPVGTNGQVLKLSGGLPTWGNDAGGISYSAGSGLSLSGSSFALDLTNANAWTGIQSFGGGFTLGGNTYTNLAGTGLSFASSTLSASLGTTIESSEITDGAIVAADIANSTITFGKLAQNSCATNEIIKWNGSTWACAADSNNTYTAGTGLALSSGAFSLNIAGLTAESVIDSADTIPIYDASVSAIRQISRANFLSGITGALVYQGTWDASSNTPILADGTGTQGKYYAVSASGSQNLGSGAILFTVGDWAVHNGTRWEKLDNSNAVDTVFGRQGTVTAAAHDYDADQIDNIASGNIVATNVQDAIVELDTEKLAKGLNSGLIFVGNASNTALGVALSGDATIDNAGALTIGADKIALGGDTTGNYIATLADSGSGIFTVANSGAENAAVTLALADDVLNFSKFSDALTLDAGTSITLGGNDLTFALTGAGLPKFTRISAGQWLNFADGTDNFGIYNRVGTPESFIATDKGSLAIDTDSGKLYIKTTDTLNTGWSALIDTTSTQTISGAKTFSSAITAPTSANTINGLVINSGALSNIASIAGSGALSMISGGTGALTLDSNSTGGVNIGIGNSSKTISIGTGTAGNTVNIATDNTTADTVTIGSALDTITIKGNIVLDGNVTVNGNVLPGTTNIYSIGTSSAQWKDLSVASSTIYIGGVALSNNAGSLEWNGSSVGGGGGATTLQSISASATLAGWARTVKADATVASVVVTLPTAVGNSGQMIEVTKIDNSANTVRIAPNGSQTINGSTNSIYLYSQNDSVVLRSDGSNSYIMADNRSSVGQGRSYMHASRSGASSALATGSTYVFDTAASSYGSDIALNTTTGIFTLQPGKTYHLQGQLRINDALTNGWSDYNWRNVTASADIGTAGSIMSMDNSTPWSSTGPADAYITPTVVTQVSLYIGGSNSPTFYNAGAWANVEVVSTPQNVVNTVDYVKVNRTTDLAVTPSTSILFNQTETGNIPYDSATGQFTLKAGKTYLLNATAALTAGDNAFDFQWRTTTGTLLGSAATANGYANSNIPAVAIFTPSADTVVTVYILAEGNSATMRGGYTQATIQQIGSTASTGVALSSLIAATASGALDNQSYGQTWDWSTATTQTGLTMTGNALTTGGLLSLTSNSGSLNSTNGLLYIANTGNSTSGTLASFVASTTANTGLFIKNNGSVGIGTTTPGANLDIYASSGPSMFVRDNNSGLKFASENGINYIESAGSNMTGAAALRFTDMNTANTWMTITSTGNVGIGTTTPAAGLSIQGLAGYGLTHLVSSNVNGESSIQFKSFDDTDDQSWVVGKNIGLLTGDEFGIWHGSNRLVINAAGNVGIGTTTPATALHVVGSAMFSTATGNAGLSLKSGANYWSEYINSSDNSLRFYGSGADRMTIDSAGNVGIGTTSPSNKLTVDGGGAALALKPGAQDFTYMEFYARSSMPNTRSGWIGYGYPGTATMWLQNETADGLVIRSGGSGGVTLTSGATSWAGYSDSRLKKDVTTLASFTLNQVLALNPVTFHWIDPKASQSEQVGFIAQEVMAAGLGDIVVTPKNLENCVPGSETANDCYGINYDRFAPYLVKAIQEQNGLIFGTSTGAFAMATSTFPEGLAPALVNFIDKTASTTAAMRIDIDTLKSGLIAAQTQNAGGISISALDNLAINGALTVVGEVDLGKDTIGEAVVKAGATEVMITFEKPYVHQPVSTISKLTAGVLSDYYVDEISTSSFKIKIDPVQSKDMKFSWHVFGSKDGLRIFSDGLKEELNQVLQETAAAAPTESSGGSVTPSEQVEEAVATGPVPVSDTPPSPETSAIESTPETSVTDATPITEAAPVSEVIAEAPVSETASSQTAASDTTASDSTTSAEAGSSATVTVTE